jgi:hypothetical protein
MKLSRSTSTEPELGASKWPAMISAEWRHGLLVKGRQKVDGWLDGGRPVVGVKACCGDGRCFGGRRAQTRDVRRPRPRGQLLVRHQIVPPKFLQERAGNQGSGRCTWFDKHSRRAAVRSRGQREFSRTLEHAPGIRVRSQRHEAISGREGEQPTNRNWHRVFATRIGAGTGSS